MQAKHFFFLASDGDMISFALGFGWNEVSRRDEGGGRQSQRTMIRVEKTSQNGRRLSFFVLIEKRGRKIERYKDKMGRKKIEESISSIY